jgi:hypothetical protein
MGQQHLPNAAARWPPMMAAALEANYRTRPLHMQTQQQQQAQAADIADLQAALEALVAMDAFALEAPATGHNRLPAASSRERPHLRVPTAQVAFDNAHDDDDDEGDDGDSKGSVASDTDESVYGQRLTPRRSQFEQAQAALSNDEAQAFFAMAAEAVNFHYYSATDSSVSGRIPTVI